VGVAELKESVLTRKLSLLEPMILHLVRCGKVGSRRDHIKRGRLETWFSGGFFFSFAFSVRGWAGVSVVGFIGESLEVVGEGEESELDVYFFDASQVEPSEPFVLFYVSEHRLDLPSLFSFLQAFFACEQLSDALAVAVKIGRTLDDAVALALMTGRSHRAALAVHCLVHAISLQISASRASPLL
jgi:hypothetical protein